MPTMQHLLNGKATIRLLQLNQIDRLLLRQELYALGRYP